MDDADAMDTDDLEEHYIPEGGIRIGMSHYLLFYIKWIYYWLIGVFVRWYLYSAAPTARLHLWIHRSKVIHFFYSVCLSNF